MVIVLKGREVTAAGMLFFAVLTLFAGGCASSGKGTLSEDDLGIRKGSLFQEKTVVPAHGEYSKAEAGTSKTMERAFENSPPLIPHDLTGMLPIAVTGNLCVGCHMPESAAGMGATPIPKSHLMDLGTGKDLKGKLDGKRFDCMQCHVPQVEAALPVKNLFRGEFRDEQGRVRSNLEDVLNEGVTAD